MTSNFEKVKHDIGLDAPGVQLLCSTHWTVRTSALTSVSENYEALVGNMGSSQRNNK